MVPTPDNEFSCLEQIGLSYLDPFFNDEPAQRQPQEVTYRPVAEDNECIDVDSMLRSPHELIPEDSSQSVEILTSPSYSFATQDLSSDYSYDSEDEEIKGGGEDVRTIQDVARIVCAHMQEQRNSRNKVYEDAIWKNLLRDFRKRQSELMARLIAELPAKD